MPDEEGGVGAVNACCGCECHKAHDEAEKQDRERKARVASDAIDIMLKSGCSYFSAMDLAHMRELIRTVKEPLP
jgi:hypothetical protein